MLIGEVARQTDATKDAIRLYERKGFIKSQPLAAGSRIYRDYSEEAVKIIQDIRRARSFGVPLKNWKVFYDEWTKSDLSNRERRALLDIELLKVRAQLKRLRDFEKLIVDTMRAYTT